MGESFMVSGGTETEVKIRVPETGKITDRLSLLGFNVSARRVFEANTLYDTADGRLRSDKMLLRLREAGEKRVVTWKGPGEPGRHKNRLELETSVGSLETMRDIFLRLGYEPSFRYEKYRTEFTQPNAPEGTVTLDETPIGTFVELEGPGDWIDQTAVQLGFAPTDYVLDSYGTLYQNYCREHGLQPKDMVFPS